MIRTPNVKVYPHEIKPGDEFFGYEKNHEDGGCTSHFCQVKVNDEGIPLVWGTNPITDEYDYFTRRMTWSEEKEWYKSKVDLTNPKHQLNLIGIHTDLYDLGDACHEMWNGWISTSWEEQLITLDEEDFFIVGIAPCPHNFQYMRNPVYVICEYENGDRLWCHAEKDWIDDMREASLKEYTELMGALNE